MNQTGEGEENTPGEKDNRFFGRFFHELFLPENRNTIQRMRTALDDSTHPFFKNRAPA
jgi:hypothetical protein